MDREQARRKVEDLRRLANSGDTPEAANARRRIEEITAKYRLRDTPERLGGLTVTRAHSPEEYRPDGGSPKTLYQADLFPGKGVLVVPFDDFMPASFAITGLRLVRNPREIRGTMAWYGDAHYQTALNHVFVSAIWVTWTRWNEGGSAGKDDETRRIGPMYGVALDYLTEEGQYTYGSGMLIDTTWGPPLHNDDSLEIHYRNDGPYELHVWLAIDWEFSRKTHARMLKP